MREARMLESWEALKEIYFNSPRTLRRTRHMLELPLMNEPEQKVTQQTSDGTEIKYLYRPRKFSVSLKTSPRTFYCRYCESEIFSISYLFGRLLLAHSWNKLKETMASLLPYWSSRPFPDPLIQCLQIQRKGKTFKLFRKSFLGAKTFPIY